MKQATRDLETTKQAAQNFRAFLEEAAHIEKMTAAALVEAEQRARQIAAEIDSIFHIEIGRADSTLRLTAGERSITMVGLSGVASDARLRRPRAKLCSEILVFGHTQDREKGSLIACLRIFADGTCTDGEAEWKLGETDGGTRLFISALIANDLLCSEVYWPPVEEQQPLMEEIPIAKVQSAQIENPCVGFECSLRRNGDS